MGTCKVKKQHNKKGNFFVAPGNGQALLGMPDIEILDILTINCNTIGTEEAAKAAKCSVNRAYSKDSGCEQQYTNTRQEADRPEKCHTNTDSNPNSKSNNLDKPMFNTNEIISFLALIKRMSVEITQQLQRDFKDVFKGIVCFDGTFL